MKLGMPTLIELPDINKTADLCEELELSFIELNMNMPILGWANYIADFSGLRVWV